MGEMGEMEGVLSAVPSTALYGTFEGTVVVPMVSYPPKGTIGTAGTAGTVGTVTAWCSTSISTTPVLHQKKLSTALALPPRSQHRLCRTTRPVPTVARHTNATVGKCDVDV